MKTIYEVLDELEIHYEKHEHPAVFTVDEAAQYERNIHAAKTKNLFLRNKKGDAHYLVIAESTRKVDLKALAEKLGESKLSFASPDRMMKHLGLTPGSVSPFGLINDGDKSVRVIVDKNLFDHEKVGFHPNINTATLVIGTKDFRKFLDWTGNQTLTRCFSPRTDNPE